MILGPFKCAFAPGVVITDHENTYENQHLNQSKRCEGEIITHKNNCPGQEKNSLDVEYQEQHGHDVVPNCETFVRLSCRIDPTFIRTHLVFSVFDGAQKPAQNDGQNRKSNGHDEKDHHRPVTSNRTTY